MLLSRGNLPEFPKDTRHASRIEYTARTALVVALSRQAGENVFPVSSRNDCFPSCRDMLASHLRTHLASQDRICVCVCVYYTYTRISLQLFREIDRNAWAYSALILAGDLEARDNCFPLI